MKGYNGIPGARAPQTRILVIDFSIPALANRSGTTGLIGSTRRGLSCDRSWSGGNGTSDPMFRYRSEGENKVLLDSHNLFDGNWHNVVWRVGADRVVDIFDNGERVGGGTVTNTGFTYNNIGRGYTNSDYMHIGDLADIRIYGRQLTDGEIALLYESA